MSKAAALSLDAVESILVKITDKFTETVKCMLVEFRTMLNDCVENKLKAFDDRLDQLEKNILERSNPQTNLHPVEIQHNGDQEDVAAVVARTLHQLEQEREQIKQKTVNVIITGLVANDPTTDKLVVETFCESHLTVKPRIVRTRRIGQNGGNGAKVCVTLESAECVDDLLASSSILRSSTDPTARQVYFNRDLTRAQAKAAYLARCARRASRRGTDADDHHDQSRDNQPFTT